MSIRLSRSGDNRVRNVSHVWVWCDGRLFESKTDLIIQSRIISRLSFGNRCLGPTAGYRATTDPVISSRNTDKLLNVTSSSQVSLLVRTFSLKIASHWICITSESSSFLVVFPPTTQRMISEMKFDSLYNDFHPIETAETLSTRLLMQTQASHHRVRVTVIASSVRCDIAPEKIRECVQIVRIHCAYQRLYNQVI